MFEVSCSAEIRCAPEVVFAYAGDYANDPMWRGGVVSMRYETGSPPAAGSRTIETMRSMGTTVVTVAEVTRYTPSGTAFRSVSGPVSCEGSRAFVPSPAGTLFTYSLTLRPAGAMRIVEPLLRFVIARQVRADVRRLKQRLEAPNE